MPSQTSQSSSVVPIFGTPFAVLQLPEALRLNSIVAGLLAARAAADKEPRLPPANPLCYRSRDDLLNWNDEPLQRVTKEALGAVWSVITAVNDFTEAQLQSLTMQARAWFTIVSPDGCVPASSYSLTSWCAMYCVEEPQPSLDRRDSGVLRLYESRLGTTFSDATNSTMRVPFATGHYAWRPVAGQLAVFPAWMNHEIALVRSPGRLMLITFRVRFVAQGQEGQSRW
jgi:hypothetical protein